MTGRIQYALSPVLPALPFVRDGKLLALATEACRMLAQVKRFGW